MRHLPFTLLLALLIVGCAAPPSLSQKQKERQTWLLAHRFRNTKGLVYSRTYASLVSVERDFALGPDDVRGTPQTPLVGGAESLMFRSHDMFFVIRGAHDEEFIDPHTACVVSVSIQEEPNQALLPTTTAVTPPAGQESRQP